MQNCSNITIPVLLCSITSISRNQTSIAYCIKRAALIKCYVISLLLSIMVIGVVISGKDNRRNK
jgi:hypothetical protein